MARVAVLFEFSTLNGGERSLLALADRIGKAGIELIGLAPSGGHLGDALAARGIVHIPFSVREQTATLPQRLATVLNDIDADLLHANSLAMARHSGRLAHLVNCPCTAHLRDILKLSTAAVEALNANHRLIAVSQATRDFHTDQGVDARRIRVIYNGIDSHRFTPRPATGWLRRELGLNESGLLVATIGQIALRKAQDVLAAAAARVRGDLHYLVIGERYSEKPESRVFEETVFERFHAAGLGQRVHRLGYRDDIPALLTEIDILVHPAHQEPLGRVLLEAAASGCAILATRVGGTPEIIEHGVSGRLVPADDPVALAESLDDLASDGSLRVELGQRARETIVDRFSLATSAASLLQVWDQALGADRSSPS